MSALTMNRIQEYAHKMGVVLREQSSGPSVLNPLVQYINDTNMCNGFIITTGPDRIQHRDGYDINQTHLYIAYRQDNNEIIGFVMFADQFLKTHHNKDMVIDHPNFKDKTKVKNISVVLDICAAPEPSSARRREEKKKKLKPVRGIKGVGSLLMLVALSQCRSEGAVLFVSQKIKQLKMKLIGEKGQAKKYSRYDIWQSTPSGSAFYDKMDFDVLKAYDSAGDLLGGSQIRYRDHRTNRVEADAIMRKYTKSASRVTKAPHPRQPSPPRPRKAPSPPRPRKAPSPPRPRSRVVRPRIVDSPASSVSSGRVISPQSHGGVQRRKSVASSRGSSPRAVLNYLREMKDANRSQAPLSPDNYDMPSPDNRSASEKSRSSKSSRTPSARNSWARTPSPDNRSASEKSRSSKSRRTLSVRDSRSSRSSRSSRLAQRPHRMPATGIYCGNKATPRGRVRGNLESCYRRGVGVGLYIGGRGGGGGRSPSSASSSSSRFGSRQRSRSRTHARRSRIRSGSKYIRTKSRRHPQHPHMKARYYGL